MITLPPGRPVELQGRGTTFVREVAGADRAVLLLHGWTVSASLNWFPVFGPLAGRYRLIAPDHRGHGQGIRSVERFSLEACADDAAALLEHLGTGPAIVVGYSMGGTVAQLLWRRHPNLVRGLVLCATAGQFLRSTGEQVYFGGLRALAGVSRRTPVRTRQAVADWLIERRVDDPWVAQELRAHDALALVEAGAAIGEFDATEWLPAIDVPTAVIAHELDTVVPTRRQLELARSIRDAELHRVVAGHDAVAADPAYPEVLGRALDSVDARAQNRTSAT
ncbi:MAG: alpha/beta fold hydrolase [Acidimicrobiales bacterium]